MFSLSFHGSPSTFPHVDRTNVYLSRHRFTILQPAVGRLRLPVGLALPEEVGLDGQGCVGHCLEPVRFS